MHLRRPKRHLIKRAYVSARSALTHVAADAFFQGLSRAGRLHPMSRPERHGIRVEHDVPYVSSGRAEHHLDIYHPPDGAAPRRAVLYLHGGAFRMLSKETHWLMALMFARAGYVVFNISYRLAPRFPFPAALEDACDALVFLQEHAAQYGIDPKHVVFAGESAGANLATSLSLATCYARPEPYAVRAFRTGIVPDALILGCGILQVSDPGRFARRRRLPALVRGALHDIERGYLGRAEGSTDLADPLLLLERAEVPLRALPPCFAFVGTKDPLLDDTRRLDVALARLNVPHEVRYYPGQLHAFHALPVLPAARAAWRDTFTFLSRYT